MAKKQKAEIEIEKRDRPVQLDEEEILITGHCERCDQGYAIARGFHRGIPALSVKLHGEKDCPHLSDILDAPEGQRFIRDVLTLKSPRLAANQARNGVRKVRL